MEAEREVVRHSNRPMAAIVLSLALLAAGWLAASSWDRSAEEAAPTPTSLAPTSLVPTSLVPEMPEEVLDSTPGEWVLNGVPGIDWWEPFVDPDEVGHQLFHVGAGDTILLSGFEDGRAPLIRSVNPAEREILWEAKGFPGTRWPLGAPTRAGPAVLIADTSGEEGLAGTLFGFNLATGEVYFSSPYEVVDFEGRVAQSLEVEGTGLVTLVRSNEDGLMRIDPTTGRAGWSTSIPWGRLIGSTLSEAGGGWAIAVANPDGVVLIDPETGLVASTAVRTEPPDDCEVLRGPTAFVTVWQDRPDPECVLIAADQMLTVQNKGFDRLAVGIPPGSLGQMQLDPDEIIELGMVNQVLGWGANELAAEPYALPTLWYMRPEDSPSFRFPLSRGRFGPVRPGMTLTEASEALGLTVQLDYRSSPGCLVADIVGDPYSPRFMLDVVGGERIERIVDRSSSVSPSCL